MILKIKLQILEKSYSTRFNTDVESGYHIDCFDAISSFNIDDNILVQLKEFNERYKEKIENRWHFDNAELKIDQEVLVSKI